MNNSRMRDEFECWAHEMGMSLERHESYPDTYRFSGVGMHWVAWKASRVALLNSLGIDLPEAEASSSRKVLDEYFAKLKSSINKVAP